MSIPNRQNRPSRATAPRRAATLTAATAAIALVAACGTDNGAAPPDEPVDLRMTVWSANDAHHEIFDAIAASYIEENPDLVNSVAFDAMSADTYVDALTTQIAGGEAPDMAWIMEGYAAQFVDSGVFANLTPTLSETDGYDMDDLIPGAIELWSDDGDLYGYPFSNSPFGVYVNLDLLDEAGQENPRDLISSGEWTYDELMKIAAGVSDETSAAGFQAHDDPYSNWNGALGQMWLAWGQNHGVKMAPSASSPIRQWWSSSSGSMRSLSTRAPCRYRARSSTSPRVRSAS